MTLAKQGRTISGIEAVYCFWAISQLQRPLRTLRKPSRCTLCKKEIAARERAYGHGSKDSWHEMCALGIACQIEPGVKAILANGHYRVTEQTAKRIVIEPVRAS